MKISAFSDRFNVSNDTVRYYMKLNLIISEKKGGHYFFNKECIRDMEEILKLKEMNFSLQEIKEIFNFKRMGKLTSYQRNNYYQSIYKDKVEDIETKINYLKGAKEELEDKINNLEVTNSDQRIKLGIDLTSLSLFCCPECDQDLLLAADKVVKNQVIEGSLECGCGNIIQIKEGILYTDFSGQKSRRVEDNHIEKYIKTTDPDFLDKSYNSLDWMRRHLDLEDLSGKVIMEPGSGYGHFLRQIYDRLADDSIYICIDNDPQINLYLKKLLEMTGKRARVIFITANLPELPLKDDVVDLLIDFTGMSCFSFENQDFLPELINRYLKEEVTLLATFIIYHKYGGSNIVPGQNRANFNSNKIRDGLLKLEFKLEEEYSSESEKIQKSMGKYETFAQPGDYIYSYQVKAKRWS